jgi:hypothetical protein
MDVASFVFAAVGFVDQAIKTGTVLKKLIRDYPLVGNTIVSAIVRLEAQKYTLELWHNLWVDKASRRSPGPVDAGLKEIWGERGYFKIIECLGQVNVKFGEAHRILASIDPKSVGAAVHLEATPQPASSPKAASPKSDRASQSLKPPETGIGRQGSKTKKRRWYHRLSSSTTSLSSVTAPDDKTPVEELSEASEERAKLAGDALKLELSPGAKFKWSLSLKDDLRLLLAEIDDWLKQLRNLAQSCEELQGLQSEPTPPASNRMIRTAAKALYAAVLGRSGLQNKGHQVDLKLEREHTKAEYFDGILGHVSYVDETDHSLKFPLLVTDSLGRDQRFLLIAESIRWSTANSASKSLRTATSFSEIVEEFAKASESQGSSSMALPDLDSDSAIILHFVCDTGQHTQDTKQGFSQSSFDEVLVSQSAFDPLMSSWWRLQIACTIAVSVLHLHETGWIPEHLQSTDFHFLSLTENASFDSNPVQPFISHPSEQNPSTSLKTPFDCLKRTTNSSALNAARDERTIALFHNLGIVLFELGRGKRYQEFFPDNEADPNTGTSPQNTPLLGDKALVLEEVEKIPFGRSYRELVKICLEGRLYPSSALTVDSYFQKAVIEK